MAKQQPELRELNTPLENIKWEMFCQLYATDTETFGNGVACYIEAFKPEQNANWYNTARSSAWKLLQNVTIIARINEILESANLNDAFADKQLGFLLAQHADFTNKLGAIREYNKLKQRITDKVDITSKGEPITGINYVLPKDGNNSPTTIQTTPSV